MIDQFAQHQRYRGLSERTIRRRSETLEQLRRWLAPLGLERAKRDQLEQFISGKPSASTRHAYRSDLRAFYGWAADRGLVDESPAAGLDRIRVPRSLPRPIDVNDVRRLLSSGSLKVRRMIGLQAYAGFRVSEIAHLDAADVWLHANPAVVVVRRGKGAKDRSVPMHPDLRRLMDGLPRNGPVFLSRARCHQMTPRAVSELIHDHMVRCAVAGTPHQLRHTFGTELARRSGGDMVLTAELMGHESATTTMGYVRLARTGFDEVVASMYEADDGEVA